MASVNVQNLTGDDYSIDASIFSLQGNFMQVRANIPGGQTVTVQLPNGASYSTFVASEVIQTELTRVGGPRLAFTPGPTTAATGLLGAFDTYQATSANPPVGTTTLTLTQSTSRAGALLKIRITSLTASAAGETYTISALDVNGTNVLEGTVVEWPASTPAGFIDFDLSGLAEVVPNAATITVVTTIAGHSTLSTMIVTVYVSQS
jgi:hypothetical protein